MPTEQPDTGIYVYGDGVTEVRNINGGVTEQLTATDSGPEPSLEVGINPGGDGTINIAGAGSVLEMVGENETDRGIYAAFGRDGGTGRLNITNSGTFLIQDLDAGPISEDWANSEFVEVGRGEGSVGEISVDGANSTFTIQGGSPELQIGRGGTGIVTFTNGAVFNLLNTSTNQSGNDSFAFLQIGRGVGNGIMSFDSSSGTIDGTGGKGGGIEIGRGGGTGSLSLLNSSIFTITGGTEGAFLDVGNGIGSLASLLISDSTMTLNGTGFTGTQIGCNESSGTFDLRDTAILNINSDASAYFDLGLRDGFGVATIRNSTISLSGDDDAYASIGAYGGTGQAIVDDSTWNFASAFGEVGIELGHQGFNEGSSGNGRMVLRNGASINFNANTDSNLNVGGRGGSTAQLYVLNGSVIDMDVAGGHGDAHATLKIGAYGAASALVFLEGPNSEIRNVDYVLIGHDDTDIFSAPGGNGALIIRDGAEFGTTDGLTVGTGGKIGGWDGTINGPGGLTIMNGGMIDLHDDGQFGDFTINTDTFIDGAGHFRLEMNDADNDLLVFNGDFNSEANAQLTVTIEAVDGFEFTAGELRVVAQTFGGGDANAPVFFVTGQNANFAYYGGRLAGNSQDVFVQALNSGSAGGVGILDFGAASPTAGVLSYNATANNGRVTGGRFGAGVASNVDHFLGTNLGDTLRITVPGNGSRAFTLDGRGGADNLLGGAGVDTLLGGAGTDTLNGGGSADIMRGGADGDIYVVDNAFDTVDDASLGGGTGGLIDTVQSSVTFSLLNSARVLGNIEHLTLTGVAAINGTGNGLINTIIGNNAANTLDGGANNDTLNGLGGNDILIGGLGKDTMTGGANNDIFRFGAATHSVVGVNADVITDFDDFGDDRIDVSALFGPAMTYRHNQVFTAAGQVRINDIAGADLLVEVNTGGSLAADFAIRLTATALGSMAGGDFVL